MSCKLSVEQIIFLVINFNRFTRREKVFLFWAVSLGYDNLEWLL